MAEGDGLIRNNAKKLLLDLLAAHTLKLALCKGAIPSIDGTVGYANLTEIAAANYTAGGKALTNVVVAQSDANDNATLDADDVQWDNLGAPSAGALTHAAVYDDTDATKRVLGTWELVKQPNGAAYYKISWNASGILAVA
jgi:Flp pilus assembly protein CpaB